MTGFLVLWTHVRLGILHEMTYRSNLGVQLTCSVLGLLSSLAFLAAVFTYGADVAGWRPAELLGLWGVFYLLTGLMGAVVQPSLNRLMEDIRLGTLDFTLLKPVDAQLLASVKQVEVWRLIDAALGLGLLVVSLTQLREWLTPLQAAAFLLALVTGSAIVYSCCVLLASLAFWFGRVENALLVFLSFWEAGRWPVAVYPEWLRATLTVLVPIAFATTIPTQALTTHLDPSSLASSVALAIALLAGSRWVWCRGVRRYSGASA
jgi:ABC-2 type transport system permease protein